MRSSVAGGVDEGRGEQERGLGDHAVPDEPGEQLLERRRADERSAGLHGGDLPVLRDGEQAAVPRGDDSEADRADQDERGLFAEAGGGGSRVPEREWRGAIDDGHEEHGQGADVDQHDGDRGGVQCGAFDSQSDY